MTIANVSTQVRTNKKTPCSRRRIPLSLQLFIAMLLLLGAVGVVLVGGPACRQHLAIQHLREFGVEIRPNASRVGPKWFRRWIGKRQLEALGTVQSLNLSDVNLTDADVVYLKGLNGLEWAALNDNPLTDAGIPHLGTITTLRALRIAGTHVTDAGLAHLKGLKHLEVL